MPDYSSVERYLDVFVNYEVLPGFGFAEAGYDLAHVRELLRRLGDPHLGPLTVHVAGSKGKGSVSAMIAGALTACGYPTALYTSPHLVHLGERIQVDGVCATPDEMCVAVDAIRPHVEAMRQEGAWRRFTYFELLTALAFVHFRAKGVRAQVVEVGLGGRLDATNVVVPDVCVITPISLEHTAVLGDTLVKIAGEKAGIIKPGAHVVCAPQETEVGQVIESTCSARGVPLVSVGRDLVWEVMEQSAVGQTVRVRDGGGEGTVRLALAGTYQAENAATALAAVEALRRRGMDLDGRCVAKGLEDTRWPGRFQVLAQRPLLVLDGAHNPASMRRLAESVAGLRNKGDIVFVLGFSGDKDVRGSVAQLSYLGGRFVLTRSSQPRALALPDIAGRLIGLGLVASCAADARAALRLARSMVQSDGVVVVAGSLYLVGDVVRGWLEDVRWAEHWTSGPAQAGPRHSRC